MGRTFAAFVVGILVKPLEAIPGKPPLCAAWPLYSMHFFLLGILFVDMHLGFLRSVATSYATEAILYFSLSFVFFPACASTLLHGDPQWLVLPDVGGTAGGTSHQRMSLG